MVVCIPTLTNEGIKSEVYSHFGSAKYYCIYNTDTGETEIIENGNSHHEHGKCNPANKISNYKVEAVISGGMGKRALSKLNESGIKVYLGECSTVDEAVTLFKENKLKELTLESACGGHHH